MRRALIAEPESRSISANALGTDEFAALIESFAPATGGRFAVAVSGGPDSMALAYCVSLWVAEKKNLLALIVDHGLRPESAGEAEETKKKLEALGMHSETLRWEHEPVVTKLHATARKARYRLLIEACKRHGIRDLLLAHQREDQAETILMRLAKGSGVDGLAGMSAESIMDGVHLLRPFLNVPKERLIATCRAAKLDFIEDSSNRSDKFARGRLRRVMPLLAEEGLTVERLADLGARAADAKAALDHHTHAFLRDATQRDAAGVIRIHLAQLQSTPRAIAGRALALCLQDVHPEDYAPEYEPLMRITDALRTADEMPSRTLQGCLIGKSATQAIIMREFSGITDAPVIRPGESAIWDERWRVILDTDRNDKNLLIRPLGHPPHEILDALAPRLRHDIPQGRARAGLPALWSGDKIVFIPSLKNEGPTRSQLVSIWPPGY